MGLPHTSLGSLFMAPRKGTDPARCRGSQQLGKAAGLRSCILDYKKKCKAFDKGEILHSYQMAYWLHTLWVLPTCRPNKAKDICFKPTGRHCDSIRKTTQLALSLKSSHHWDWDSKPALGSEAKTHSEQMPAKDSKGN